MTLIKRLSYTALRHSRRLVILVIGATLILVGLILIVTPGPAIVVLPIGLGVLSIEYAWARRLLRHPRLLKLLRKSGENANGTQKPEGTKCESTRLS